MENRFKSQITKILQSTLNSCRPKNTSDVSDQRLFRPENPHNRRLIDLFSPKPQPLPSTFIKPKPHTSHLGNHHFPAISDHRRQHSVSPVHEKTSKRDRKKKTHHRRRRNGASFSSITDNYYYNWWSSEEDDQSESKTTNTLVSRRSVSSDAGDRKTTDLVGLDGFAVAKDSSDPYGDFRVSMVDMIVEKGIFGVEELENLVECFLSLNSEEHHKVIIEVFAEIWETLISDLYKKE